MNSEHEHYSHVDYLPRPVEYPSQVDDDMAPDWLLRLTGILLWLVLVLGAVLAHHGMSVWMVAP